MFRSLWLHCLRSATRRLPSTRRRPPTSPLIELLEGRCLLASGAAAALVADVVPGPDSSNPERLTNVDGTLFFSVRHSNASTFAKAGVWTSDGTAAGTILLKPGDVADEFVSMNNSVFFGSGSLWRTDGTTEGTTLVQQVPASRLTTAGNKLYFVSNDTKVGAELWVSDGTTDGTVLVEDIHPGTISYRDRLDRQGRTQEPKSSYPDWLTNLNGTLLFAATDGKHGRELWRSDGTDRGTSLIKDIGPQKSSSDPQFLTVLNNAVYFAAAGGLWKTDGTSNGTVLVKSIIVSNLVNVDGTLFFAGHDGLRGWELWKSDGTSAGTVLVKDIIPGEGGASPGDLTASGGVLYFTAHDSSGHELWRSNGSAADTFRVKDIHLGTPGSDPQHLTDVNGLLYFVADDGSHGRELWQSNGTEAGTTMVQDINPGSEGSWPDGLVAMNNKLYFAATDPEHGRELWDPPPVNAPQEYLLVADAARDAVLRYDAATGRFVDDFVSHKSGGLDQAYAAIFGPDGNGDGQRDLYVSGGLFVGTATPNAVFRYDGVSGAFIDVFTQGDHLESPRGIVFGPDGNLYVADMHLSDPREGRVVRFDGATGQFLDDFVPLLNGGLRIPNGLVFGPSGKNPLQLDLYVSSTSTNSILRYDGTSGQFLGEFVAGGSGGLVAPFGLTFGPDGNLYVASRRENPAVLRFQGPSGKSPGSYVDTFVATGSGGLLTPFGLIFGPDGNGDGWQDLYVTNSDLNPAFWGRNGTVKRYDGLTGVFLDTFVAVRSGRLDDPVLMTFTRTDSTTLAYMGQSLKAEPAAGEPANRSLPSAASLLSSIAKASRSLMEDTDHLSRKRIERGIAVADHPTPHDAVGHAFRVIDDQHDRPWLADHARRKNMEDKGQGDREVWVFGRPTSDVLECGKLRH